MKYFIKFSQNFAIFLKNLSFSANEEENHSYISLNIKKSIRLFEIK